MDGLKQNVFDYLTWRGDISFEHSKFNEIDSLIFSIFAYIDFSFLNPQSIMSLPDAAEKLMALPDELRIKGPGFLMHSVAKLFASAAESERFKDVNITEYVDIIDEEREMQFAAITFLLPDHTGVIAFRGTDTSLIGWKEDLNMSFISGIPSQIKAAEYSADIMDNYRISFRLVGHSKGGNLAVWASAHLSNTQKKRVLAVYSNDGPGFNDDFLDSDSYKEIREKIVSFVPESSIVGVLLSHDEFTTISSSSASVLQHDPFSWNVQGRTFVYSNARTASGRQMERVINAWIKSMSPTERESFVESVFDLLGSSNAKTLEDLDKGKIKTLISMQKTYREMEPEKQAQLNTSLRKVVFNKDTLASRKPFSLFSDRDSGLSLSSDADTTETDST